MPEENDEYYFCEEDWNAILDIADKILSFETLDDFSGEGIDLNNPYDEKISIKSDSISQFEEKFFNDKEKYCTQLRDIRRWSSLVLFANDTMGVHGLRNAEY